MELKYKGKDCFNRSRYQRSSLIHVDEVLISKNGYNDMWMVEVYLHAQRHMVKGKFIGTYSFWKMAKWDEAPTRKEAKAWALARLAGK
jgi:hypothetical protein